MSTEMIFASIVIAVATAAFVMVPFVQREAVPVKPTKAGRQQRAYETLQTEKQRVLRSIRDLDQDYDMDKLPTSIYVDQRQNLVNLYAAIVRRIDDLEVDMNEQRARVEDAIAAYRKTR